MESLLKQTRARFPGSQQDNKEDVRGRKIQQEKTQSLGEKKRGQSWIRRQFSRQMSWEDDFSSSEYPTAVAAAAYAIQSLDESKPRNQGDTAYRGPDKTLSKMKSKVDDSKAPLEPLKSALKSSDETSRASFKDRDGTSASNKTPEKAPSLKKRISFSDTEEILGEKSERQADEKAPDRLPSMKRPSSFADKTPETTAHPGFETQPVNTRWPYNTKPGPADSEADAWEKEQLASIRDRYDKLRASIEDWEDKKKSKARRKIERTEAELDKRRARAVKSYRSEITRIEAIAGRARAHAEENQKNEELKAKEKANKIRVTGQLPATCFCF